MCPNNKNRGHRPASAGSSHFIGWKKKQLWSAQEGGKRPGRRAAGLEPDRARQTLLLPQSTGCGGWSWRKKIIIIPSTTIPGTLDKSACSLNSDPKLLPFHHIARYLPIPCPPAKPHFLEALGPCRHFSRGPRLTSSALTFPGYTWVYHGPHGPL